MKAPHAGVIAEDTRVRPTPSQRDRSPMHETGIFPDLIELIYDAGLQPARWNDVVVKIKDFVGGQACGVFSKDSISKLRRDALLLRRRSAFYSALFGDPFEIRSAQHPAAVGKGHRYSRPPGLRRISQGTLLSGMAEATGVHRRRERGDREVKSEISSAADRAVGPAHGRCRDGRRIALVVRMLTAR